MCSVNDLINSNKQATEDRASFAAFLDLLDGASDVVTAGDSDDMAAVVVRHGGATVHTVLIVENEVVYTDVLTNYALEKLDPWACTKELREYALEAVAELQADR